MFRSIAILTLSLTAVTAQAALLGRAALTPGGTDYQAYYDDQLNITWLADANYTKTVGLDPVGWISWGAANAWMDTLNAGAHLGATTWRLPSVDVDGDGTSEDCGYLSSSPNCADNELGYMFWRNGVTFYSQNPFSNIVSIYWSSTEWQADPNLARYFNMADGDGISNNKLADKSTKVYVWAVADGDALAVVPIPGAVWLFGSALGVMGWMRRTTTSKVNV